MSHLMWLKIYEGQKSCLRFSQSSSIGLDELRGCLVLCVRTTLSSQPLNIRGCFLSLSMLSMFSLPKKRLQSVQWNTTTKNCNWFINQASTFCPDKHTFTGVLNYMNAVYLSSICTIQNTNILPKIRLYFTAQTSIVHLQKYKPEKSASNNNTMWY